MENQNQNVSEQEQCLTYEEILEEYRRRQMLEHLTGPVISLVLHVVIVALLAFFIAGREITETAAEIEFEVREMEIEPLDPDMLDELEELDTELDREVVPTIEPPEVQVEELDSADMEDFADDMAMSELDMEFAQDLDVRPSRGPVTLPVMMSARSSEGRRRALDEHAGRWGRHTERAVIMALEWLKDNQREDGSWEADSHGGALTGMTGLALLAFLAHGETHDSERYGETVRGAIDFLVSIQQADGTFKYGETGAARGGVYSHGIASYALSEAYALTRVPAIRPAVERAVERIIRGQRPDGGFDYNFNREGGARDRCTSVAAWMAQAMKAAQLAGVRVEGLDQALELAAEGFKLNYSPPDKMFYYASYESSDRDASLSVNQTPVAVLCLQLLGHGRSSEVQNTLPVIMEELTPDWNNPADVTEPLYGWYYATQAMFHAGMRHFREWNELIAPALVRNQRPDGSWRLPASHGRSAEYGPVYATAFAALNLTVYYRYLPTYQDPEEKIDDRDIFAFEEDEITLE